MSIKGWKSILGFDQRKEHNMCDSDRMIIITSQLETQSTMNCFYRPWHSKKSRFSFPPQPFDRGRCTNQSQCCRVKIRGGIVYTCCIKNENNPSKYAYDGKMKVTEEGWIKSDELQQPFAIPFTVESPNGIRDTCDAKIL